MSKMEEIIKNEIDNLVNAGNKIVNKDISIGKKMEGKELAEVTS